MKKPFFYRLDPARLAAELFAKNDNDIVEFMRKFIIDLMSADMNSAKTDIAKEMIADACDFIDKKKKAAEKRWASHNKQNDAPHKQNDAMHMQTDASSSSSSSTEAKKNKTVGKRFSPPTHDEVASYCRERNKGVNYLKWYDHYQANGWMVGKNKMKDWKAAVRTWEDEKKVTKRQGFNPNA